MAHPQICSTFNRLKSSSALRLPDPDLVDNADSGGKHNQGDPKQVRAQQVNDLHPEGSEERQVSDAQPKLQGQQ
jgi:hypothetical protein